MTRVFPFLLLTATAVLSPTLAFAEPGDHLRVGEAVVTPAIDLGLEYRSNLYHEETDPKGGGILRVAPGVMVAFENEDTRFDLTGNWELRKQLWIDYGKFDVGQVTDATDRGSLTNNLDRWTDFGVGTHLDAFRKSAVGLKLADDMTLRNNPADAEFFDVPFTTQYRNTLAGQVRISPGSALSFVPGGKWIYDSYQVPGGDLEAVSLDSALDRSFNARNAYGGTFTVDWKFFPRTSALLDTSVLRNDWRESQVSVNPDAPNSTVSKPDSTEFRIATGVRGRLTERIAADAMLGYGFANYSDAELLPTAAAGAASDAGGLDGFLVTLQLAYKAPIIGDSSEFKVGYKKDFADALWTNYVAYNQIYAGWTSNWERFDVGAGYSVRLESYHGEIERHDVLGRASLDGGFKMKEWARLGLGGWWQQRASDNDAVEYDDFDVHLLATFTY